MYVLQLTESERHFLLSLLNARRHPIAAELAAQLGSSEEVFGLVTWSDSDIASQLTEHGLRDLPENIRDVRNSYHIRHIGDSMIEHGWGVLEEAVSELKHQQDDARRS